VLGDRHEHLADAAVRRPVRHPDPAAGLAHPQQLRRSLGLVGGEHRAEDRHHHVELPVREGQVGGVGLDELDLETIGGGSLAAALEQRRDEVGADHAAPRAPGRGDRAVAAAAGDVEHLLVGHEVERFGQLLGHVHHQVGDHREVALRPGLLLDLADSLQVRCVAHLGSLRSFAPTYRAYADRAGFLTCVRCGSECLPAAATVPA
jgi:hypothetical protein